MKILADSWEVVTKGTIINFFKKAGIIPTVQQAAINDSDDPFKDLQESLNELRKADSSMVPDWGYSHCSSEFGRRCYCNCTRNL